MRVKELQRFWIEELHGGSTPFTHLSQPGQARAAQSSLSRSDPAGPSLFAVQAAPRSDDVRVWLGLFCGLALTVVSSASELLPSGGVTTWGRNDFGQAAAPSCVTNVVAVEVGLSHSLAVKSDGTLIGWGQTGAYKHFWSGNRKLQGLGLGLALVQGIARLHGCDFAIQSDAKATIATVLVPRKS